MLLMGHASCYWRIPCLIRGLSWQRRERRPKQRSTATRFYVVLSDIAELSVGSNSKDRQAGRNCLHGVRFTHGKRHLVGGHEDTAARIDGERARVQPARIGALNSFGLAAVP